MSLGIGTLFFRTTMHQNTVQDGVTYLALIFFTIVSSAAAPLPQPWPARPLTPTETSFSVAGAHDVSVFACSPGSPLVWLALAQQMLSATVAMYAEIRMRRFNGYSEMAIITNVLPKFYAQRNNLYYQANLAVRCTAACISQALVQEKR